MCVHVCVHVRVCACVCARVCVHVRGCVFSTLVAASREDLGEDGIQEEPG